MRISLIKLNLLICKKSTLVPIYCLLQFRSRHHRERLLRWADVKGTHRTGRRANRPPPCSILASVNEISVVQSPRVVCQRFLPAVCASFLLACKTMYRSLRVYPRGRPLLKPPDSCSCCLKLSPKSRETML
ncbi:uncharacterized protein TNCV_515671 [Trichonephila clavipes]|nr:uncharacterized protein TNCV_515671 [Trichonephila clavipes]